MARLLLTLPVALACLTHCGAVGGGHVAGWGQGRAAGLGARRAARLGRAKLVGLRGGHTDTMAESVDDGQVWTEERPLQTQTADGRQVVTVTEQYIVNEVMNLQSYLPHLQQYQNPLLTRAWPINTNFVGINETVTDTVFCNSLRAQSKGLTYNQVPPRSYAGSSSSDTADKSGCNVRASQCVSRPDLSTSQPAHALSAGSGCVRDRENTPSSRPRRSTRRLCRAAGADPPHPRASHAGAHSAGPPPPQARPGNQHRSQGDSLHAHARLQRAARLGGAFRLARLHRPGCQGVAGAHPGARRKHSQGGWLDLRVPLRAPLLLPPRCV
jgi:hypothetical protein